MGISPIRDRILDKNYLFALEFHEGFLFGRTVRRRVCEYMPYPLIDTSGTAIKIAASSAQSELEFRDPRNPKNKILYLDKTTNDGYPWFLHGAIGSKPQQINVYLRLPESKEIPGKFPNIDPIRPSSGDDTGFINSLNSPYDEPTDHVEIVFPPGQDIGAEYYNKDAARPWRPVLHLLFALYWVKFFNRPKNAVMIRRIANREVPATFLTMGFGDTPMDLGDTLKKDWGVVPMTLEEASV